jgi:hypothetical protein
MQPGALLLALLAAQAIVGFLLFTRSSARGGRRQLAGALCVALPGAGVPLALWSLRLRGRGDSPALALMERTPRPVRPRVARDRMPVLERLLADARERRAALAGVAGAPSDVGVEAVRWTLEHGHGESVIEAAMALEELNGTWEARLAEARKALGEFPTSLQLLGLADLTANLLELAIVDTTLAAGMCEDACELYRRAADATRGYPPQIYARWARLELRAMRPETALSLLTRCEVPRDPDAAAALERLRNDARFAARRPLGSRYTASA